MNKVREKQGMGVIAMEDFVTDIGGVDGER